MDRYSENARRAEEIFNRGLRDSRRDYYFGKFTTYTGMILNATYFGLLLSGSSTFSNWSLAVSSTAIVILGLEIGERAINERNNWLNLEDRCRNRRELLPEFVRRDSE